MEGMGANVADAAGVSTAGRIGTPSRLLLPGFLQGGG
jgi:hypothetical protein